MSAARWRPVAACRSGLDPPNIKISDSGGLDLEGWCLDAWMLAGLEEVTEVTAFWREGIWKKFPHARASGAWQICVPILGLIVDQHRRFA